MIEFYQGHRCTQEDQRRIGSNKYDDDEQLHSPRGGNPMSSIHHTAQDLQSLTDLLESSRTGR